MKYYWLLILLCCGVSLQAQTLSGKVVDAKTLEPLPFANVFLNNTTIGTTTELNGEFLLKNVRQPAIYEVIFSFVGYESYKMKISLSTNELALGTIKLKPSETELVTVEVKGTKDTQWEKKMKRFKKVFLGDDDLADLCVINNPWVIDFDDMGSKLKAAASSPIEMDNKALGYKLTFYLKNFVSDNTTYLIEGNVRFEEMASTDEVEKSGWALNRSKSYWHSRQHLFKAMVDQRIKGEGFNLYTEINELVSTTTRSAFFYPEIGSTMKVYDTTGIVTPTGQENIYSINLKGRVEVHYKKEKIPVHVYRDVFNPVSWITLKKGFVLVNRDGVELSPAEVTVAGDMNSDRVAHLLPINYLPDETMLEDQKEELLPFLEEKVYIHTDKPYYYPGESIWMKGYINYRAPSLRDSLSGTVYVELIDPMKKSIVMSSTLKIDSGFFRGDFYLPETFESGSYSLRAYTSLERNFGNERLFIKPIPVLRMEEKVDHEQVTGAIVNDSSLTITPDKKKYQTREKITLALAMKDEDGHPLASNLSISVTDASQVVPFELTTNILTGYPLSRKKIDGDKSIPYPIEYGVTFKGRFFNGKNKPEKATLNVLRISPTDFTMTQSDEHGIFTVSGIRFYDTATFSIQAYAEKGGAYGKAELMARDIAPLDFKPVEYALPLVKTETVQRMKSEYELPPDSKLLEEVVVRGKKIEDVKVMRSYGKADYVLKAKDLNSSYGNLLMTLPGKFPGLVVRLADNPGPGGSPGDGPHWVVYVARAATSSILFPKEVLVMINDVAVGGTPADVLGALNPMTVESVELKTRISVLNGTLGGFGVLSIYTKTDVDEVAKSNKKVPTVKVPGYVKPRKFRFPKYDDASIDPGVTDFRSLLYWNPEVRTNEKTGTATVSFYAADLPVRYRVVVEGVTQEGRPVRSVSFVDVGSR